MEIEIIFEKEHNQAAAYFDHTLIGVCQFIEIEKKVWNIIHTEVDPAYQGKSIARKLVNMVIKEAQEEKKQLIADCSYAKKILTQEKNKTQGDNSDIKVTT
ncbi:MAG TPA: N-acetyltransferase [Candidatus Scybalousia intestinigallinarum]|nr:N-acetyltransferase [Candidatus Scybalousia intestinigallinarum]